MGFASRQQATRLTYDLHCGHACFCAQAPASLLLCRWLRAVQTLLLRRRSERRGGLRRNGSTSTPFRALPGGVVAGPQLAFSFERGPDAALLTTRAPELPPAPAELCLQVLALGPDVRLQTSDEL